jgi:hypothetical protein
MVVISAGVLALLVFAALSEVARRGSASARVGAMVEGIALIPLAGLGVLVALVLKGLTCDDGCGYVASPDWRHDPNAWQWSGQLFVAVVGFFAIAAAIALIRSRSYRWATAAMTLAAASFGAWAAFLAPLGNRLGI